MTRESKATSKAAAVAALGALLLACTAYGASVAADKGEAKSSDQSGATSAPKAPEPAAAKQGPHAATARVPAEPAGSSVHTGDRVRHRARAVVGGCGGDDVSFSIASADGKGEEVRHLLITVTNTGDTKCRIYGYPTVKFAGARSAIAVIEDSKDAPVTLAPGGRTYAALLAHGARMDTYDTTSVPLRLQGARPGSVVAGPVAVDLPGPVSFDDAARVTYWIPASGLALRFIMSS